jgi:hypothetical protein
MSYDGDPISYTFLQPGAAVLSSDGQEFGRVESVLIVEEVAVFDGIVVTTSSGQRFVDADRVDRIFTTHVVTTLAAHETDDLPLPLHTIPGAGRGDRRSLSGRMGRMFGRGGSKRVR